MMVTQLPRLLDESMKEVERLHPVSLSLTLNMAPLSTATMILPANDAEVVTGSFVELFTPYGSAGIFRCVQTEDSFTGQRIIQLEHGLVTLNDSLIPGESGDMTTSAREALETFLSVQDAWQLDQVDVPDDEKIAWSYDYTGVLDAVLSIADEYPAYTIITDQSKQPWALSLVRLTDEKASECRLTRNIATLNVEEDRTSLCTRLYVRGLDAPMDADTIDLYGVKELFLDGGEDLTQDELTKEAQRQLEDHKHPGLVVSVSAFDLSKITGESLDAFHLGKICRVCLPEHGRTIDQRIVTLEWLDLYGEPESVRITLASKAMTTASEVKGLIVNTTTVNKKIARQGRNITLLAQNIDLKAESTEVTQLETRVKTAEVDINGIKGEVSLKASQKTVDNLSGQVEDLETTFTVGSDGLRAEIQENDKTVSELKATIDGLENWVTDADGNVSELTNTVRGLESKVETAGGKVSVLTNTADGLTNTVFGQGGELSQLMTRADEIRAAVRDTNGSIGSLSVKSDSVTAKVKGVEGQVSQLAVTADGLNYTLTKHGQELSSIKALVDEISLTVTDTNGNMGTLITKSDSVTAKVSNVDGRVSQLAVTADGMAYTLTKQGQELSALRVLIDEISLAVKDTNGALGQLVVKSDSITGKVVSADERFSSKFEMLAGIINLETKADGTVVSVRMDAAENSIRLKADKTYVENLIADEISATNAQISNLTSGLTTAMVINSNWFNGTNAAITYLSADAFTHNGALVSQRSITMGSVTSAGKALSTGGELDLQHSHAVTVNDDGTITLGEVSAEGGNFKIADTKAYKDGVSAAKASVTLSAPNGWQNGRYVVEASNGKTHPVDLPSFSVSGGTAFDTNHKTTVYFSTPSVTGYLKSAEIDASGVYKNGWNECRAAMSRISNLYTISQNAPGTLYMLVNGNYTSVGSDWVKVSAYSNAYSRPAAIA